MSRTIDERVLEMRFDNKQFEENVSQSMDTLSKLKRGLNMDGATTGLEQIGAAAKGIDFSTLGGAVETITSRFSNLGIIGVQILKNIADEAYNTGKKMVESLTIEPIKEGFSEYELKMGSVQTIMAGTGEDLDTVMQKLNELNTYADQTIYSFSDMTSNIGKFTNAGVKLDDAVAAIQGVANVAAISGANSAEASRAMYNFAQALSAGYVKLIDWKSIENANMATVDFKTQLLEAAVAAGTVEKTSEGMYRVLTSNGQGKLMDNVIDATHNFNDSLAYQWMTTEALTETLSHYSTDIRTMTDAQVEAYEAELKAKGYTEEQVKAIEELGKKAFDAAQDVKTFTQLMDTLKEAAGSGWAETWEILAGDFEEAKKLWTGVSDAIGGIIDQSSKARNELLKEGLSSGWKQLIDDTGVRSATYKEEITAIAREHGIAIDEIIEKNGSFEDSLKDGWLTTDILKESIDSLLDKSKDLTDEELRAQGYTESQIQSYRDELEQFEKLNKAIEDGTVDLDEYVKKMDRLSGRENLIKAVSNAWQGLLDVIRPIREAFQEVFPPITGEKLYEITDRIRELSEKFKISEETAEKLKGTFSGVFRAFSLIGKVIGSVVKGLSPMRDTFSSIADKILDWTSGFGDFMEGVIKSAEELGVFEEITNRVSGVVEVLSGLLRDIYHSVSDFLNGEKNFTTVFETILDIIGSVIEALINLASAITGINFDEARESVRSFIDLVGQKVSEFVGGETLGKISEKVSGIWDSIKSVLENIKNADLSGAESFGDKLKAKFEPLAPIFEKIGGFFTTVWNTIKDIGPKFAGFAKTIGDFFGKIGEKISAFVGNADVSKLYEFFNSGVLATIGVLFARFVKGLGDMSTGAGGFLKGITDILDGVRGCLESWQDNLKSKTLMNIAIAIAILTAALFALGQLDTESVLVSLGAIATEFGLMLGSLEKLTTIMTPSQARTMKKVASAMILMSVSLLLISVAVKSLAELEWEGLLKGLVGIAGIMAMLIASTKLLSGNSDKLAKTAFGLILFGVAIRTLVKPVKELAELSWEELAKGLVGVGVLVAEIAGFLKIADFDGVGVKQGLALVLMAAALQIMAGAVAKMGAIDLTELAKGLGGIALVLVEIAGFTKLMSTIGTDSNSMVSMGIGLAIMAVGLTIMAGAVAKMGAIPFGDMIKGLFGLGVVLAGIFVFADNMGNSEKIISTAFGLLILGAALGVISLALKGFGSMQWDEIARGLVGLAGSLGVIALTLQLMKGTAGGAAALALVAVSLALLVPSLMLLSTIKMSALAKGLLALAGVFVVLGVAALVLAPIAPVIMLLSGAIALLGVGVLALSAGVLLLSAALATLAVSGTAGSVALVAIISSIIGLIPLVIQKIGEGIVLFVQAIANGTTAIVGAVVDILTAILDALIEVVPKVVELIFTILDNVVMAIVERMPDIVQAGFDILMAFLTGIRDNIGNVVTVVTEIIVNFLNALADNLPDIIQAGWDLIIAFVDGLTAGVEGNMERLIASVLDLATAILNAFLGFFGIKLKKPSTLMEENGGNLVKGIIAGINGLVEDAKEAISNLGKKMKERFEQFKDDFKDAAKNVVQGLIDGIGDKVSDIWKSASTIGQNLLNGVKNFLGIESPSKEMMKIGRYSDEGLAIGLTKFGKTVSDAAEDVGDRALDSMSSTLSGISDAVDADLPDDPVIRPVLDLSEVERGSGLISQMLDTEQSYHMAGINAQLMAARSAEMTNNKLSVDNHDIIMELESLRAQFTALTQSLNSMQIVMDSGKLVGQLIGPLDAELGTRLLRASR